MARTTAEHKIETLSFRIAASLKTDLAALAAKEAKPIGELLRELIRERIKQERRRAFEAEARRQCDELNRAARHPNSDEAEVLRELDASLDAFADESKWD